MRRLLSRAAALRRGLLMTSGTDAAPAGGQRMRALATSTAAAATASTTGGGGHGGGGGDPNRGNGIVAAAGVCGDGRLFIPRHFVPWPGLIDLALSLPPHSHDTAAAAGLAAGAALLHKPGPPQQATPPPPPLPAPLPPAVEPEEEGGGTDEESSAPAEIVNWSGTHAVRPASLAQPESEAELVEAVAVAHAAGTPLRPIGSALSPNGLAFQPGGQVSLALLDRILAIDPAARTVTVQAGARVQAVTDVLRPHGLTLPVYASIREQSIGGYVQAGVHGTGATIGPADAYVSGLRLVTPAAGVLDLDDAGPDGGPGGLFRLARVGLGSLGVVSAATIKCEPLTWLVEHTWVATRADVAAHHASWLAGHKHIRYMWVPHADAVVCVGLVPAEEGAAPPARNVWGGACGVVVETSEAGPAAAAADARAPLEAIIPAATARRGLASPPSDHLADLSPMLLRQWLLNAAPLDCAWVKEVNSAEVEHWRAVAAGAGRSGWSDQLLGFDCAGPQWVLEVAFPTGGGGGGREAEAEGSGGATPAPHPAPLSNGADLAFMGDLLARIEGAGVPAHAPIEQRWSAGSPSTLSPAAGPPGSLHCWVGVILYLPEEGDGPPGGVLRAEVDGAFAAYAARVERELGPRYGATEHWAKVEPARYAAAGGLDAKRAALAARFGPDAVASLAAARARLDPKNVLGSPLVDALFPHPLVKRDNE